jgi:hypothetical protein
VLVASKGVRRSKLVKCFIVLHCMRWRLGGRSWRENIADAWGVCATKVLGMLKGWWSLCVWYDG